MIDYLASPEDSPSNALEVDFATFSGVQSQYLVRVSPPDVMLWPGLSGAGEISGIATINGAPSAGLRLLLLLDGTIPAGSTQTNGVGGYSFTGVPAGNHAVVAVDLAGGYRSKVIHTVVA